MKTKQNGFTLIEVMITLAIIGMLAAISYPSYTSHINKSKRVEAQAALVSFANAMEMWRMQHNNSYLLAAGTDDAPTSTGSPNPALFSSAVPISGGTKTYDLTISTATAATYTLTAAPVAADTCGTLTLNNTGATTPTVAGCW